tara:strand:+ start:1028 stop:2008 length:981 start_codon:yes stop_codon:yes gene_type:complete
LLKDNEKGRNNSVFASKLKEHLSSKRSDFDLEAFLINNDLQLYAPYVSENFNDSELPLTITWHDGVDESGVTEGLVLRDNEGGRINQAVLVDDSYAYSNPTYVLMPIEDPCFIDDIDGEFCGGTGGGNTGGGGGVTYTPRDIDCRAIESSDILRVQMPEFRLTDNTRSWPYRNYLYLWAITGSFTRDSNGFVNASPNVNELWWLKEVSRSNAKDKKWLSSGISFVESNWKEEEVELRIAVAHKKSSNDFTLKGTVKISTDGDETDSEQSTGYELSKIDKAQSMFNVGFDRCSTLASITSDEGYGLRDGHQIFHFGKMEFYLKHVIQ